MSVDKLMKLHMRMYFQLVSQCSCQHYDSEDIITLKSQRYTLTGCSNSRGWRLGQLARSKYNFVN